ncbi:MAG: hypothetical protein ABSG67_01460 [Thermoguttaceae bacterium]|jgi:hypothetical protein
MTTEDERRRNREKQKRFQKRHPGYNDYYCKRKRLLNPQPKKYSAQHRTFELADPRDQDRLPCIVGYCKITTFPVWSALWAVKDISNSRWAAWFRELAALGLMPVERLGWSCGSIIPISMNLAHRLVVMRIAQINRLSTGNPFTAPSWLLRDIDVGKVRSYPVGRVYPDGRVERFASIKKAVRITGYVPFRINYWIHIAGRSSDGCIWFDD